MRKTDLQLRAALFGVQKATAITCASSHCDQYAVGSSQIADGHNPAPESQTSCRDIGANHQR
ncbi:MAG: hypothetical protein ACREP9_05625 [Candidatus Dormibacteraceae bacterium]